MEKDNSVTQPSTDRGKYNSAGLNREADVRAILKNDKCRECIHSIHFWNMSAPCVDCKVAQILSLFPKVLSDEEIQSLLKELRHNSGGKILMAVDIYRAISEATVDKSDFNT